MKCYSLLCQNCGTRFFVNKEDLDEEREDEAGWTQCPSCPDEEVQYDSIVDLPIVNVISYRVDRREKTAVDLLDERSDARPR